MENEIGIWFLLLGLIVPRFTLLFWWLFGNIPDNTVPFIADMAGAILIPRILILVYIYGIQGFSIWFGIHLAALFIVWIFNGLRILVATIK